MTFPFNHCAPDLSFVGDLTTAVFTSVVEFPLGFLDALFGRGRFLGGAIDLGLDLIRGIDDPIFLPFRGLYFDGNNDFMRLVDFVFSAEASIAVVMRKPAGIVGTLFSLDTVSLLPAELALSFEGPGSELRVYNADKDAKFDLAFTKDAWFVLGFSWGWSNGAMNFKLAIDNETDTLSIEGLRPYLDLPLSTHLWGNSRLTQFGITRLFETFLEVYIHSISLRNTPGTWPPFPDHEFRLPGLWNCAWNSFFDESSQSCLACHADCGEGCIRPGRDNCKCFDIECKDCVDSTEGSDCRNCGLLTSFARGSSEPCDCKIGFSRDTSNGGAKTNRCALDIKIPCIALLGRCSDCREDTGNWFGDCLSCGLGFFRQQDAASCLPDCPTGSIGSIITNECEGLGLGHISSVFFNLIGPLYKGFPFGLYRLASDSLFDLRPFNTITRGVFFNENSGHIKISGIVLNTNFSAHFWARFLSFQGDLLSVEAETPTTNEEEQVMTYTCGESASNAEEADVGCNYNNEANTAET